MNFIIFYITIVGIGIIGAHLSYSNDKNAGFWYVVNLFCGILIVLVYWIYFF